MTNFITDCEADGPVPGIDMFSMVCFGAVALGKDGPDGNTFYGQTAPISDRWDTESLAISGFTREQHLEFPNPALTMVKFGTWLSSFPKPWVLWSDNNQFDGMFVAYYTNKFLGSNPFGYSSRRISDLACGANKDLHYSWKHLRKTRHTHNPVDDATGNVEALKIILDSNGIRYKI